MLAVAVGARACFMPTHLRPNGASVTERRNRFSDLQHIPQGADVLLRPFRPLPMQTKSIAVQRSHQGDCEQKLATWGRALLGPSLLLGLQFFFALIGSYPSGGDRLAE